MKTFIKRTTLGLIALFLFAYTAVNATAITITANTNWSAISSGSGTSGQPSAADAISVTSGAILTVDVTNGACLSLQIGGTSGTSAVVFSGPTSAVVVSGTVTLGVSTFGGTLDMSSGGTLTVNKLAVSGTGTNTFTSGTAGTGDAIVFAAASTLPATIFTSFDVLTVGPTTASGSATTTASVGVTINTLNINSGNFALATAGSTSSTAGTVNINGASSKLQLALLSNTINITSQLNFVGSTSEVTQAGTISFADGCVINVTGSAAFTSGATNQAFVLGSGSGTVSINVATGSNFGLATILSGSDPLSVNPTTSNTGILTLSANNTYSGGTILNAGELALATSGKTTQIGTGTLTLNGGSIDNTTTAALTYGSNIPIKLLGSFSFVGSNNLTFGTGAFTLGANATVTVTANTLVIGGNLFGTSTAVYNLTKAGVGTLSFTLGSKPDTLKGLTITAGTFIAPPANVFNLQGNFSNSGTFTNSSNTVIFNGSSAQTIGGSTNTSFYNLTVNNSTGVTLSSPETVSNTLTLTSGQVTLGSNNLTIPSSATVSGASSSSYIVTNNTGVLSMGIASTGTLNFPVGDATATDYTPISLNFTSGTFPATVNVLTANSKDLNNNSSVTYLNRYWTISQSGLGTFSCSVTGNYLLSDVVEPESSIATGLWPGSLPWTKYSAVNSTTHQLSATVTAFGDITGITAANPSVSITPTSVCSSSPAITANTSGDDPTITYVWGGVGSGTTASINATTSGSYSVTATDGNGFTATSTVTVSVNTPAVGLSSITGTDGQMLCATNAITSITYTVDANSTGATVTGLPTGVTGSFNGGTSTLTITGTPSVTGAYTYTVTTVNTCSPEATATGTITINAPTISLSSISGTDGQSLCAANAITNISYLVGGVATSASVSALPTGVSGSFDGSNSTFTISGTPTIPGAYTYTVTTSGGSCGSATASGAITVNGDVVTLTSALGTDNQSLGNGVAVTNITYTVSGAATNASVTGLPTGVTGAYSSGTVTISGTPSVNGVFNYTVTTSGDPCGAVSANGKISISAPTIILSSTTGTDGQTVCNNNAITDITYLVGGTATGATVSTLPTGVSGSFDGSNSIFTITGTPSVAGVYTYTVTTTGGLGSVTASGGITVNSAPAITVQPSTSVQSGCSGFSATLSVTATGAGLTYQWYSNTANSNSAGTLITGATSSNYTPVTTSAGTLYYYCVMGGSCTPTATTNVSGAVTVNSAPAITVQPSTSTQNGCSGFSATESVTATGAGLTYQWYSNTTNSNSGGALISGATSSSYTPITTSVGTLYYYCTVSGTCTPAATTNISGAVTVSSPPVITVQPTTSTQTGCPGFSATVSVTATGAGLAYQWYSSASNSNSGGTLLSGATSSSYTPVTTSPGTLYYYCAISGTCTPPVTTNVSGSVVVNSLPTISLSSITGTDGQTVCNNSAIASIAYSVGGGATGATVLGLPTGVSGSYNSGTFTITGSPSVAGTATYTVTTSGATCTNTATGTITVNALPTVTITGTTSICAGAGTTLTGNGANTFTWSTGGTYDTIVPYPSATSTYTVSVIGTNTLTTCSNTANKTVTVNALPAVSISGITSILSGGATQLTASGANTYAWTGGPSTAAYTITPTSNTIYTVTGTNTLTTCSNTATQAISVNGVLVHFWDFNSTPPTNGQGENVSKSGVANDSLGTVLIPLVPSYSALSSLSPVIRYYRPQGKQSQSGVNGGTKTATVQDSAIDNGSGGSFLFDYSNNVKYCPTSDSTNGNFYIRARQPNANAYVYITAPTVGYENVNLDFAVTASSGTVAPWMIFSYTNNGGKTWRKLTSVMDNFTLYNGVHSADTLLDSNASTVASVWYPVHINFSSDDSVNNNPNFMIRWFFGGYNSTSASGNVRYDNVAVLGDAIEYVNNASSTNVTSCYGDKTGTASVAILGGTSPYTYSWNTTPAQTSSAATALGAGSYTVTVTDAVNVAITSTVTITQPTQVLITPGSGEVICSGNAVSLSASGTGGTGTITYSWMPGSFSGTSPTVTPSPTVTTTYTVTGTDGNSCTATATQVVTVNAPTISLSSNSGTDGQTLCDNIAITNISYLVGGTATGASVSTLPTGVTGSFNSGTSTFTISGTPTVPGVYTYTVTTSGGSCGSATASGSITVNGNVISLTSATGTDNQSIPAVSTPITDISYTVTGGATGATVTGLPTGVTGSYSSGTVTITGTPSVTGVYTYTVTTSGGSCSSTSVTGQISVAAPTISLSSVSGTNVQTVCSGTAITAITYLAGGTATGATVSTLPSGVTGSFNIGTSTFTISGTPTVTGVYGYTVTTSGGVGSAAATGSITVNGVPVINLSSAGGTDAQTVCPNTAMTAITYTVSGTATGASVSALPTGVSGSFNGGNSTFTISGTPSVTGAYTYTVTTSGGLCNNVTATGGITIPTVLTATLTASSNPKCNGNSNGSATVTAGGGTLPYSYSWNTTPAQTSSIATAMPGGTYTVTVTSANSCPNATATVALANPTVVTATLTASSNPKCNGNSNGSATVTAGGGTLPYTYSWNSTPAQTSSVATALSGGAYTVTVADANTCPSATATVTLTDPAVITATVTASSNPLCNNSTNGTATVTAGGGTLPYSYSWNTTPAQTTSVASGLSGTGYTVTISDVNLCPSTTATVALTVPSVLTATISASADPKCHSGFTGSATVTAGGGTLSYTYSWNNAATTSAISSLPGGTYVVNVKDGNGCTASTSVTLTTPAALTASITSDVSPTCYGLANGTETVTVGGGTGGYTYSWNTTPAQTTSVASNLKAGNYMATVSDANSCTTSASKSLTSPTPVIGNTTLIAGPSCNATSDGSASVSASGGAGSYSYSWNTLPAQTTTIATGLAGGIYTVTIMDGNSCVGTSTVQVTAPAIVAATITGANPLCNGNINGTATANATGGTSPYTYSWNTTPAQTSSIATALSAGSYTLTVTDANLCPTGTATVTLTDPAIIVASVSNSSNPLCNGSSNGSATANATGGASPYTYSWSTTPAQTSSVATALSAGSYTVTVTDFNTCPVGTATVTLTDPSVVIATVTNSSNPLCNASSNGNATANATGGTLPYSYSWNTTPAQTSSIATALGSGSYTVTVTDANICPVSTATVTLSAPANITATVTTTVNPKCTNGIDGVIAVTAGGGTQPYSYTWSTAPIQTGSLATGLEEGNYTVTVTDVNLCPVAIATATLTSPSMVTVTTDTLHQDTCGACAGGSASVIIVGGYENTIEWKDSTGSGYAILGNHISDTATHLIAGTYVCIATDSCGNSKTDTIRIKSTVPTSINGVANNSQVNIYPVPNNGHFIMTLNGTGFQAVSIFDELGKELFTKTVEEHSANSNIVFDMSMYADGVYFARITTTHGEVNKKIIIQK